MINMKPLAVALACLASTAAQAEISDNVVRVGVLNDNPHTAGLHMLAHLT